MLSHQGRPKRRDISGTVPRSVVGSRLLHVLGAALMIRSLVMRHSMSYAGPQPTGCTWVKSSPTAKQMLGRPAVSLVLQPQRQNGSERVHRQFARCMASSRGSDDKSWSELASMPQAEIPFLSDPFIT